MPQMPAHNRNDGEFGKLDTENWSIRHGEWIWVHKLILFGWFFGLVVMISLWTSIVLEWQYYIFTFFVFGLGGLVWPYRDVRRRLRIERSEWILGSLIGMGWTLGGLYLVLNFLLAVPIDTPRERIVDVEVEPDYYVYSFESKLFENQARFRQVPRVDYYGVGKPADELQYDMREGLFGMRVIRGFRLYKNGIEIPPNQN